MPSPSFVLLYVNDPTRSATFYAALLEQPPVEAAPGFVMFALPNGWKLGLWARSGVLPVADENRSSQGELGFPVGSHDEVDALFRLWSGKGLPTLQAPIAMDFGYTFVCADPDGHRLRVFAPAP